MGIGVKAEEGFRGVQASGVIEGKIPKSLAESQKVANSCQKAQGCAAADLFCLGYPGSGQGGRPNSKILLGTRARMGGGQRSGNDVEREGAGQEGCTGFHYSSRLIISPLNVMQSSPPTLLLTPDMLKVPGQLSWELELERRPSHHGPATHHFLLHPAALGAPSPCTSLAVILL